MDEKNLRKYRCCFTGHRPDKMDFGEEYIKPLLEKGIDNAIKKGYVTFITGMATGADIWAGEIILEKRKNNQDIRLICALLHPDFESKRSMAEKLRFKKIIKDADLVKQINNNYFFGCYQAKNEWMVDRSSLVIAVFNGKKGGTKNTIDYANKKGVKVWNVI